MDYDDVIDKLIKHNPVARLNLLYYDSCTSLKMSWKDEKEFTKQLQIRTTSFPAKKDDILSVDTDQAQKFRTEEYVLGSSGVLGLHSTLVDKGGRVRYWLMLDLNARPTPSNLRKVKLYLGSLLRILKIKPGGYILETDNSYHFIGKKFVSAAVFKLFLNSIIKSNGGDGLADVGFCGHTLAKDLDVCLRIQRRKGGKRLKVVAEI